MTLSTRIDAAVQSALDEKRIVGAVIAVMQDGGIAHLQAYGLADREARLPERRCLLVTEVARDRHALQRAAGAGSRGGPWTPSWA